MFALGSRLVARGHEVTYETWARWREPAEAGGMRFSAAPEYPAFPTRDRPLKPYEAVVQATSETRREMVSAQPDVVVHDILTLAPAMAAELEGVPVATLIPHVHPCTPPGAPPYAIGARLPRTAAGRTLWRAMQRPVQTGLRQGRAQLNETRIRLGLPPVRRLFGGISPELCLVATFPQLEHPREWPPEVRVVGPLLWELASGDAEPPDGKDPLILLAPSTSQDPDQRLLRAALLGLAHQPVRVLAATNRKPIADLPSLPTNVKLVDWISYSRLMPRCSLVICHAGHGTVAWALASGCPVLAVPHAGDMGENAARLDALGLGVRLPWRLLSPSTLRLAVRRALADTSLAARAKLLGAWAAANDGALVAARLVEELALSRAGAGARRR